jgi:hypothetical protein
MRHDVFAQHARQLFRHDLAITVVSRTSNSDRRMDSTFNLVDEIVVRMRDHRDQHLTPMAHERLQEADEVARQLRPIRLLEHLVLALRTHARRFQERAQAAIRLHRIGDLIEHLTPAAQIIRALRELEKRLGVILGDCRFAHYWPTLSVPIELR